MPQMTIKSVPLKIKTQLFRRRQRVFVGLSSLYHADLEKFKHEFVQVVLKNDKQEKIFSFAAKIARARQILPRGSVNRMYIEIPLAYRPCVRDYMFVKGSVTAIIYPITPPE